MFGLDGGGVQDHNDWGWLLPYLAEQFCQLFGVVAAPASAFSKFLRIRLAGVSLRQHPPEVMGLSSRQHDLKGSLSEGAWALLFEETLAHELPVLQNIDYRL